MNWNILKLLPNKPQVFLFIFFIGLKVSTITSAQVENAASALNPVNTHRIAEQSEQKSREVDTNRLYIVRKVDLKHKLEPDVSISPQKVAVITQPYTGSLPENYQVSIRLGIERKIPVAYVFIPKYIRRNGMVEELLEYEMKVKEQEGQPQYKTTGSRVYAVNSVLSSGTWYKIAISEQGLYKLDYNFFKDQLGVDPSNINPQKIRIFGNGGEMLPEDNLTTREDDLKENAIQVFGENDGTFNVGDYVLFYANGPHTIVPDSVNQSYSHQFNVYSEKSYYFINLNQADGKRVATIPAVQGFNSSTDNGDYFTFYEKDSSSLFKVGRQWFSKEFSDLPGKSLNQNYNFSLPDIITGIPLTIRVQTAGLSYSGTSHFEIFANGQLNQTHYLSAVGPDFTSPYFSKLRQERTYNATSPELTIGLKFTQGAATATGYLDYIEILGKRKLICNGYVNFSNWTTVAPGSVVQYTFGNAQAGTEVWDITYPLEPEKIPVQLSGSSLYFSQTADDLHRFIVFDGSVTKQPEYIGKVNNQNLHHANPVDLIIICYEPFLDQAKRLAEHHKQKRGISYVIVTPQQIYNEFSSGSQDVMAIRDFIKMYYDKSAPNDLPDNVLLFGDASYDYKDRIGYNTNYVPVYETEETQLKTGSYATDDCYGFLDDDEDPNKYSPLINTLDVGIGRIPASSSLEATNIVDKIIRYDSPEGFGSWKNNMLLNADDGDNAGHLDDAEYMAVVIEDSLKVYNLYKNYIDAYTQESTPAGQRVPAAQKAIQDHLFNGTFVINYNGHGSPRGWCDERILTIDDVRSLSNKNKLPLFITATCDFAPFELPDQKSSGELLLTNPDGGAIALMTTTQLVFSSPNREINENYYKTGFKKINGKNPTLGDAYRLSKNLRYASGVQQWISDNYRKFALLGDPALPLAFPKHNVVTDSINGVSVQAYTDTLKALTKYTISGRVVDENGQILDGFNGTVYPTVFDKPARYKTLQTDPGSLYREFDLQNNILFKGKASIANGKFRYSFVLPKDINYAIGPGKISYYAEDGREDAAGYSQPLVGGSNPNAEEDQQGPVIKPYINDEKFVNGGITRMGATLLIKLKDDNGINASGNSVGHDITAVLDNDPQQIFVLNNFYEADQDDYTSGVVRFPIDDIEEGTHFFTIKAWDVYNNSSTAVLEFVVVKSDEATLERVYNYPNPFSTKTQFMFEHNMPNQNIWVNLKIFNMSGQVVKSFQESINTPGNRYDGIYWDGKDQLGDKLANGVYLYNLSIKGENGFSANKMQKLVLLR